MKAIETYIREITKSLSVWPRGRTDSSIVSPAGAPITVVQGQSGPRLQGRGYWKTTFRNGAFSRTLYTGSTRKIVVGSEWMAGSKTVEEWTAKSPASTYNRD